MASYFHAALFWLALALSALAAAPAAAADVHIAAAVDKTEASLDDSITLTITVTGERQAPAPQLPPLPEFSVQSGGSSSTVQIVNMSMTSSVAFTYILIPKKAGTFTIGPAKVEAGGKAYATQPITVTIANAPAAATESHLPVFAQTAISNAKPYIGEQIVHTFKLFRRVEVRNINLNAAYGDFRKEDLGKDKEYEQIINGVSYRVNELAVALFPAKAGRQEIPGATVDLEILRRTGGGGNDPFARFFGNDPFFGGLRGEHKTLHTTPIEINVQPLPEKDKPANFSHLVGQFHVAAALGKTEIDFGDTATLTLTLSGTGNVKDTPTPTLDLPDAFKVYPDQPAVTRKIEGNRIGGEKTFKFALVPVKAGRLTLPPMTFSWFDPEKKQYITGATPALTLTVRPGKTPEPLAAAEAKTTPPTPPASAAGKIKIVGKDILPIHTRVDEFTDHTFAPRRMALYLAGFAAPMCVWLTAAYYNSRRRRLTQDVAYSRRHGAYKRARRYLDRLAASPADGGSSGDTKEFAGQLSRILREYIGDRLNLQGTAFTAEEVGARLREGNYNAGIVRAVTGLLEQCESLRYGYAARTPGLLDEARALLKNIERHP